MKKVSDVKKGWPGQALFVLILTAFCSTALAFKPNTHVWIGQQVIDDLQDGRVSIEVNGQTRSYPVDAATVTAIRNNQDIYRMGHIGPDAAPGIYAGQMAIHPGTDTVGTDTWAEALHNYVKTPGERVRLESWYRQKDAVCESRNYNLDEIWQFVSLFVGSGGSNSSGSYLSAADEIGLLDAIARAVNGDDTIPDLQYEDDVISPQELAYEKGFYGHMAGDVFAHSYVNHYAGDVFSILNGEMETEKRHSAVESYIDKKMPPLPQGRPYDLIRSPSEFLANYFIFSDDAEMFVENSPHLYAIHSLRNAVQNAASDCIWTAIDRFANQIAVYMYSGYLPSEEQAQAITRIQDSIHGGTTDMVEAIADAWVRLDDVIEDTHQTAFSVIDDKMNELETQMSRLNEAEREIIRLETVLEDEIVGQVCDYERRVLRTIPCASFDPFCRTVRRWVTETGPACATHTLYQQTVRLRDEAIDLRSDSFEKFRDDLDELEETITAIHEANEAVIRFIEYIASLPRDISPFRRHLKDWEEDIRSAMVAWVDANTEIITNGMQAAMNPPDPADTDCFELLGGIDECSADNKLAPLFDWKSVWGPTLLGIPSEFTQMVDSVSEAAGRVSAMIDGQTRDALITVSDPMNRLMLLTIEREISKQLADIDMVELLLDFTNQDDWLEAYRDLHMVFHPGLSVDTINDIFSEDTLDLRLRTYDRFTDVMDVDMGIAPGSSNYMNWRNFPVVKNSITLAKLSLLNNEQLRELALDLGATAASNNMPQNILFQAIKNIDGHESWKPKANYSALLSNYNDRYTDLNKFACAPKTETGYGRLRFGRSNGFSLWTADGRYFNQLFDMPLYEDNMPESECPEDPCGPNQGKVFSRNICRENIPGVIASAETYCGLCPVHTTDADYNGCVDVYCGTKADLIGDQPGPGPSPEPPPSPPNNSQVAVVDGSSVSPSSCTIAVHTGFGGYGGVFGYVYKLKCNGSYEEIYIVEETNNGTCRVSMSTSGYSVNGSCDRYTVFRN